MTFPDELEGPTGEARVVVDSLAEATEHVTFKTVGPQAPPAPFDASVFLDTLATYPERAADLGWLDGRDLLPSLQAKLDEAQRQLERDNAGAAAGTLGAFVNEVEAQQGKKLSSEAYALLKFNAQYLIERLEAR